MNFHNLMHDDLMTGNLCKTKNVIKKLSEIKKKESARIIAVERMTAAIKNTLNVLKRNLIHFKNLLGPEGFKNIQLSRIRTRLSPLAALLKKRKRKQMSNLGT